jgi:hypothetical protein
MLALVLLGIAELLVVDVSAASLKVSIIGGGIFILASAVVGLLGCAAVCWEVSKLSAPMGLRAVSMGMAGALFAFCAALFVDAAMLAYSLLGGGVAKLFSPAAGWSGGRIAAHGILLFLVPVFYACAGALLGAATAVVIGKIGEKKDG